MSEREYPHWMDEDIEDWADNPEDDELGKPVGSCDECDVNIYADDWDGTGLCDPCLWRRSL